VALKPGKVASRISGQKLAENDWLMRNQREGIATDSHGAEPIADLQACEPRPIRRYAPGEELRTSVGGAWRIKDAEDDASAKEEVHAIAGDRSTYVLDDASNAGPIENPYSAMTRLRRACSIEPEVTDLGSAIFLKWESEAWGQRCWGASQDVKVRDLRRAEVMALGSRLR
jgi:hypothetical protein